MSGSYGDYCNEGGDCASGYCVLSGWYECRSVGYTCTNDSYTWYDRCGGMSCYVNDDCASNDCNFYYNSCRNADYDYSSINSVIGSGFGSSCSSTPIGSNRCDGVSCSSSFDCENNSCSGGVCRDFWADWNDDVEDAVQAWLIAVIVIVSLVVLGVIGCIICCCCSAGVCS